MTQKGLAPILIVLILATLVGGYLVYQRQAIPTPSQAPQPTPSTGSGQATQPSPTPDPTANWKTYASNEGKFSVQHPPNWNVEVVNSTKEFAQINIKGFEGEISIYWGERGIGGAGCYSLYGKENEVIQISGEEISVCHVIDKGVEKWLDINKQLQETRLNISASVNPPLTTNREKVLKVLSTFKFD